jgi:chemotaxis regulatin CheY-phosphate phosphatase CheZ
MENNLNEEEIEKSLNNITEKVKEAEKDLQKISENFKNEMSGIEKEIDEIDENSPVFNELDEEEKKAEEEIENLMFENAKYITEEVEENKE